MVERGTSTEPSLRTATDRPQRMERPSLLPETAPSLTLSLELNRSVHELRLELGHVVEDLRRGVYARYQRDARNYYADLRKDFLRLHRHLQQGTRSDRPAVELREQIFSEVADLSDHWRVSALGFSTRLLQDAWGPAQLTESLDRAV